MDTIEVNLLNGAQRCLSGALFICSNDLLLIVCCFIKFNSYIHLRHRNPTEILNQFVKQSMIVCLPQMPQQKPFNERAKIGKKIAELLIVIAKQTQNDSIVVNCVRLNSSINGLIENNEFCMRLNIPAAVEIDSIRCDPLIE